MPGLSRLQRATLDRMHPQGWTVADWIRPGMSLEPDHRQLGGSDCCNSFGGVHLVVNGAHVILTRRGRWVGYYAWGGRQYPVNGGRKPWSALVSEAEASGHYGEHRVPRHAGILAKQGLRI